MDATLAQDACFDFPVLIVRPNQPFPTISCQETEPAPPRPRCLKNPVTATIDVIDNSLHHVRNCIKSSPTTTYKNVIMHARGDSSLGISKHQYAVHLHEEKEILGLPPHKQWVFNGPYIDASMIRNHVSQWLYRQTGRYSPRSKHFILYIESDDKKSLVYRGVYLLLEKIANGKHRVGVALNNKYCKSSELNGGWIWQFNPLRYGNYAANLKITTYVNTYGSGSKPVIVYPNGKTLTQSMRNYFVNDTTGPLPSFYKFLWHNISQIEDLQNHIDIGSFIDYLLHTEMSLNQDAYKRSVWFFKDRDQPINAGPIWDMNLAYGSGAGVQNAKKWMFHMKLEWRRLFCNYKFAGLVIQRWKSLRKTIWSDNSFRNFSENAAAPMQKMLKNCTDTWYSDSLYCLHASGVGKMGNFLDEVHLMINATIERMHWMDNHILDAYFRCNGSTCGVGENTKLPKYNCAEDPEDNGCLQEPEKYYSVLSFPSIHQPYAGKQCDVSKKPLEEASIDPCWFSTGTYIQASYLTPFCSGYGRCQGGPDAVCECNFPNMTKNCSNVLSQVNHEKYSVGKVQGKTKGIVFIIILLFSLGVVGLFFFLTRRKVNENNNETLLEETQPLNYGT